jgi:hypothetical protein
VIVKSDVGNLVLGNVDCQVVLKVDRDYKEGEQVFASYGQERSNSDLLITYVFALF